MTPKRLDTAQLHFAIETVRLYRGISQRDIAEELSIASATLSRLANGRSPSAGALLSILAWLRSPADRFTISNEAPGEDGAGGR